MGPTTNITGVSKSTVLTVVKADMDALADKESQNTTATMHLMEDKKREGRPKKTTEAQDNAVSIATLENLGRSSLSNFTISKVEG